MKLEVQIPINASKEKIWSIITNIENSVSVVSGIEKVEILEKPENGLVGLKWIETRTMFGKTATETMWITEAKENEFYRTRAESHGAIYISEVSIAEQDGVLELKMGFSSKAVTLGAKIMTVIFAGMMKNATKKALAKDLEDIKKAAEETE